NIALWHERDVTHSSVERIIFPDSTILLDYMLHLMTGVIRDLVVYKDHMRQNLEKSRGMVFSQALLLKLVQKGLTREEGYALVQNAARKVWSDEAAGLREAVLSDPGLMRHLTPSEVEKTFDYDYHLKNVPAILRRADIYRVAPGKKTKPRRKASV
ncbi:MAG: hypothetical protein WC352_03470, partial [Candidatus Omnitrophota bacterium]